MSHHKIKTAVIGVGYLGRFHAQKYKLLENSELIGVVDQNPTRGREVAAELSVPYYAEPRDIIGRVDAVSVVTPTQYHFAATKPFLEAGIHVLLEKPFAATVAEAEELLELAKHHQVILQIGHLERFNPAFLYCEPLVSKPQFIECMRIAPFPKRGTDVDVILDLMIHDLDLLLALLGMLPNQVEAVGVHVLTASVDLASVRCTFNNGCVANLTASRVSALAERKMRIFQDGLYMSLDLGKASVKMLDLRGKPVQDMEDLKPSAVQFDQADALKTEIQDFLLCVETARVPKVSALDGLQALRLASQIKAKCLGG